MRSLVLLATALTLIVPHPVLGASFAVSGMVRTSEGDPLPEARVALLPHLSNYVWAQGILAGRGAPEPIVTARTDRSGRFSVEIPQVGVWAMVVEATGFVPMRYRPLPVVGSTELPPVTLLPDVGTSIEILDSTGKALAGVWVYAETESKSLWRGVVSNGWRVGARIGRSDSSGCLVLPRLPGERLGITAFPEGYAAGHRVKVTDQPRLVLRQSTGFETLLEVYDNHGKPIEGILVSAGELAWPAGRTSKDGRLSLGGSFSGPVKVHLFAADGRRQTVVLEPPTVDDEKPARFTFPSPVRTTGRLVAAFDHRPLAGALLWPAHDPGTFVVTDSQGTYEIVAPPGDRFSVQADATGYQTQAFRIHRVGRDTFKAPTVAMRVATPASGYTVDEEGIPLPGVIVEAAALPGTKQPRSFHPDSADSRSLSDSDGHFTLKNLQPEGTYELTAVKMGFASSKLTVAGLGSDKARTKLRFVLEKARPAHGRVVDGEDRPIPGAEVRLLAAAQPGSLQKISVTTSTDRVGRFDLAAVPGRHLDVEVRKRSFSPLAVRGVKVPPGEGSFGLGKLVLVPGAAIKGLVTTANGVPMEGVEVRMAKDDGRPARLLASRIRREAPVTVTQAEGTFLIEDLEPGERVHLFFYRAGYLTTRVVGVQAPNAESVVVALQPALSLSGQVIDVDGEPIAHSRVYLRRQAPPAGTVGVELRRGGSPKSVVTDVRGEFVIEELIPGKVEVEAFAKGFQPASALRLEIPTVGSTEYLRVVLERGAVVEGHVSSAVGEPIAGARIRVGRLKTTSDAEGVYRVDGVPTGPQAVVAGHLEFKRQIRELEIEPGINTVDLVLEGGWPIAGRAVQSEREPVEGVRVKLRLDGMGEMRHYQAMSGPDGRFSFPRVVDGRYDVVADRRGYGTAEMERGLLVTGGPVDDLEVVLPDSASVVGRILGLELAELSATRLEAKRGERSKSGTVDRHGQYEIPDLSSGVWLVKAWLSGGSRQVEARVTIEPGIGEVMQDLEFGAGFTLTGRVFYDGVPLPETSVSATGFEVAVRRSVATDHQGNFRLQDMEPGQYRLGLANHRESLIHNEDVDLFEDRELHIEISTARISGQVTSSATSRPLGDALIHVQQLLGYDASRPGSVVTVGTDRQGSFTLARLATGRHRLTVRKDGYAPIEEFLDLQSGMSIEDIELSLTPTKGLDLVVHLASGPPPPRATLNVTDDSGRRVLTETRPLAPDGFVRFATVPPGSWNLLVSAPGGATAKSVADVPGPVLALVLLKGTRLRVRVPTLVESNLVATLTLNGSDGRLFQGMGPTGTFQHQWALNGGSGTVEGVPPGIWALNVVASDAQIWQGTVVTAGEREIEVSIE